MGLHHPIGMYRYQGHMYMYTDTHVRICKSQLVHMYVNSDMGWLRLVGSINYRSLLQNIVSFIGLFAKETYDLIDPTHWSHPIARDTCMYIQIHTYAYADTNRYTCMHIPIPRDTCTYIQIHTHAYTDTNRYTYTYKQSLAHTHVCIHRYQLYVYVYTETKREEAVQNPRSVDASATTTLSLHGFRDYLLEWNSFSRVLIMMQISKEPCMWRTPNLENDLLPVVGPWICTRISTTKKCASPRALCSA